MKSRKHLAALTILMLLVPSCGVEELGDELTSCDPKWDNTIEASFIVVCAYWRDAFWSDLSEVVTLDFEGNISKKYCNGTISGRYAFQKSYVNSELEGLKRTRNAGQYHTTLYINPGMRYAYKFDHDQDTVTLNLELRFQQFGFDTKYHTSVFTISGREVRELSPLAMTRQITFPGTNENVEFELMIFR